MTPTLGVTVMHAAFSAKRRVLVRQLLQRLGPPPPVVRLLEVVPDTQGIGLWPEARRCWIRALGSGATHCLVMQDDIHPCPDFLAAAVHIASLRPEHAVSFLSNRKCVTDALATGRHWATSPDGLWGGAVMLPAAWVRDFLYWNRLLSDHYISDDGRLALYVQSRNDVFWLTCPTLLEHMAPLASESLAHGGNYNTLRESVAFLGFDQSACSVDWTCGLDDPAVGPAGSWQYRHVSNACTAEAAEHARLSRFWRPNFVGKLKHPGVWRA